MAMAAHQFLTNNVLTLGNRLGKTDIKKILSGALSLLRQQREADEWLGRPTTYEEGKKLLALTDSRDGVHVSASAPPIEGSALCNEECWDSDADYSEMPSEPSNGGEASLTCGTPAAAVLSPVLPLPPSIDRETGVCTPCGLSETIQVPKFTPFRLSPQTRRKQYDGPVGLLESSPQTAGSSGSEECWSSPESSPVLNEPAVPPPPPTGPSLPIKPKTQSPLPPPSKESEEAKTDIMASFDSLFDEKRALPFDQWSPEQIAAADAMFAEIQAQDEAEKSQKGPLVYPKSVGPPPPVPATPLSPSCSSPPPHTRSDVSGTATFVAAYGKKPQPVSVSPAAAGCSAQIAPPPPQHGDTFASLPATQVPLSVQKGTVKSDTNFRNYQYGFIPTQAVVGQLPAQQTVTKADLYRRIQNDFDLVGTQLVIDTDLFQYGFSDPLAAASACAIRAAAIAAADKMRHRFARLADKKESHTEVMLLGSGGPDHAWASVGRKLASETFVLELAEVARQKNRLDCSTAATFCQMTIPDKLPCPGLPYQPCRSGQEARVLKNVDICPTYDHLRPEYRCVCKLAGYCEICYALSAAAGRADALMEGQTFTCLAKCDACGRYYCVESARSFMPATIPLRNPKQQPIPLPIPIIQPLPMPLQYQQQHQPSQQQPSQQSLRQERLLTAKRVSLGGLPGEEKGSKRKKT